MQGFGDRQMEFFTTGSGVSFLTKQALQIEKLKSLRTFPSLTLGSGCSAGMRSLDRDPRIFTCRCAANSARLLLSGSMAKSTRWPIKSCMSGVMPL